MTFVDDNGNEIETTDQIAMTKQSVSFFNSKIKGDYSTTFTIDNNSKNRETLGYYGPQMLNQIAYTKQPFSRVRNGNILDRGYIVIQSDNGNTLSCFYVSGNSNWFQLLNGLITSLDFSKYATILDRPGVLDKTNATDGLIFPMVDWCYDLRQGNYVKYMLGNNILGSIYILDITKNINKPFFDFYPCLYLKTLLIEIGQQNGLKITGNLFDDAIFKSLVITPNNGLMTRKPFKNVYATGSSQSIPTGVNTKYTSFTVVNDSEQLFVNNTYTSNKKCGLIIYINASFPAGASGLAVIYLVKNGVQIDNQTWTLGVVNYRFSLVTSVPGDVFEISITQTTGGPINATLDIRIEIPETIGVYDYVSAENFLPDIKSIDIIKFVVNYFGCSITYDDYSKSIEINIIETIKKEDAVDWSNYFLSSTKDYTTDTAQNNYIKWSRNDADGLIKSYNGKNNLNFADGNIQTLNSLKDENTLAQLPFCPSSFGLSLNTQYLANVPLINLKDSGDPIPYTAITNAGASSALDYVECNLTVADSSIFNVGTVAGATTYEIVRITNSKEVTIGYFVLTLAPSATTVRTIMTFNGTNSGNIFRQEIDYNNVGSRILSVKPSTSLLDFSNYIRFYIEDTNGGQRPETIPYAVFTKSKTNKGLDQWKNNLAIDNIIGDDYNDPTIKELYFNKISRFLQNPDIEAVMILPEAAFQRFTFDRFIYLKTEKLTGYFFVESIENYVDGNTPVTVNLYMI